MALTDPKVRNAKPKEKAYKLTDEKGLFLLVNKSGSKYWRMDYRFSGKRKTLALGVYPEVGLKAARLGRDDARKLIAHDIDPADIKKSQKRAKRAIVENGFESVAREWIAKFSPKWTAEHKERITRRFELNIFPWVGEKDISEVTAPELLTVLQRIENRGALDTAHRTHQNCGQVFRYAIATGKAIIDPSAALKGALPPANQKHHPSITEPLEVGKLLRVIETYEGNFPTKCALKLAPLVFVRPGELRHAEWMEIDFELAEWRIPAKKMKMKQKHIVPLSNQAVAVLKELHPLTGHGKYLFPSIRSGSRPMSENTVNGALRRLGYTKEEMTGHGFRSMASTLLNEQGWNRDAIERQLAHSEHNSVRAAYNYAEHLPERVKMMQSWSDYLEGLRSGADIILINREMN